MKLIEVIDFVLKVKNELNEIKKQLNRIESQKYYWTLPYEEPQKYDPIWVIDPDGTQVTTTSDGKIFSGKNRNTVSDKLKFG